MFIITVDSSVLPEYQYIREDRWNTPVRSPDESTAKVFENIEQAKLYIERFQLGSTSHVHNILHLSSNVNENKSKIVAKTSFQNNGKGKFLVAIVPVK